MYKGWLLILVLMLGAVAGVALDRYWLSDGMTDDTGIAAITAQPAARFVCPMHPDVIRDEPGSCPVCGMDLVARHEHAGSDSPGWPVVSVSPAVVNSLGVRKARVVSTTLLRQIKTAGHVLKYQRGRQRQFRARIPGVVKALYVAAGDVVEKGDVLAEIRSEERLEAQKRHLALVAGGDADAIEQSRRALRRLAFGSTGIERLENGGHPVDTLAITAPQNGRISRVLVEPGSEVSAADVLMVFDEQGSAQVEVDVFRSQVAWIKPGDRAELRLANQPGKVWEGRVSTQGVDLRPRTRTYALRASFPMEEGLALADMFADVTIFGAPIQGALAVPREALIRTGSSARVIKVLDRGRFQPVDVVPGMESGDQVEIISGVEEGDLVVVSAQFLIDSESNLLAGLRRMDGDATGGYRGSEDEVNNRRD